MGATPKVLSVAGRFGTVAAAGELAITFGVFPWPTGEATAAAGVCFRSWLDNRGHTGAGEDELVLKHLRGLLISHGDTRFSVLNSTDSVRDRLGWKRPSSAGTEFLIAKDQWDREVFRGTTIDPKRALAVLNEHGLLKTDKDRQTFKQSIGGAKVNVVCLLPEILSE